MRPRLRYMGQQKTLRRLGRWMVRTGLSRARTTPRPNRTRVSLPMRDGTGLATDVYTPAGAGPWPVALIRSPYDKRAFAEVEGDFTRHGIVLVAQDARGRYGSAGEARPYVDEAWGKLRDGADTVDWVRRQPWCNGNIATFGTSYPGINQLLLAGTGPRGIVGQHVTVGAGSVYHHLWFRNGVFRKQLVEEWLRDWSWPRAVMALVRQHPRYDQFWSGVDLSHRLAQVCWPIVHVGGWYDYYAQGTLETFAQLQEHGGDGARGNQFLVMGPWTHAVFKREAGDLTFPEHADFPPGAPNRLEWLSFWLTGEPAIPLDEPAVRYYVMGDVTDPRAPGNVWRSAVSWPPPSRPLRLYFAPNGDLTPRVPAATTTRGYLYDPSQPAPTCRGAWDGPTDQRPVEARPDVLVFTTPPLSAPLEVTGRLRVRLSAVSSARDTDFTATLTDVFPDGRSMLLADGIVRASSRLSLEGGTAITPGERYRYDVDLGSTSFVFNQGHRIRLAISSSSYPRYDPNPNTGTTWPYEKSAKPVVAYQRICLGGTEASYVVLPVEMAEETPEIGRFSFS